MLTRGGLLTSAGAAGGLAAPALAQGTRTRVGYLTPQSGPLAAFAGADRFILDGFAATDAGANFEVIVKDSQSNPNRAAEVAQELMVDEEIDLMLVASTPETTNPVTTTAENEGIPASRPWRPGSPGSSASRATRAIRKAGGPSTIPIIFFWGLEDVIAIFTNMWWQLSINKSVSGLFHNDGDGNACVDPVVGFPPVLADQGYSLTDLGRYQNLTDDFSAQINAFEAANAEIVTGVVIPPDFTTFWTQAKQQVFTPKTASIGKAILFPQAVETLGDAGHNLSSEVWWSPAHPLGSSLSGMSAGVRARAFTEATGRQWTQPIVFVHALFEVAADAMGRVSDTGDPDAVAEAIADTLLVPSSGRSPGTARGCRLSPRATSPKRRLSAVSGGCVAAAATIW